MSSPPVPEYLRIGFALACVGAFFVCVYVHVPFALGVSCQLKLAGRVARRP